MNLPNNQIFESLLEKIPSGLKSFYVFNMQCLKQVLKKTGLLAQLDNRAKEDQTYHYLRSLLAIHQLADMIALDVPWWTYAAIDYVEQRLDKLQGQASVFEYGSGASTLWLAKRCEKVISVEHDEQWFKALSDQLSGVHNVALWLKKPDDKLDVAYRSHKMRGVSFKAYVKSIKQCQALFDLIVIDGRCRHDCLVESLPFLKQNGIILFDNSNRQRYQSTLGEAGLEIQRFHGRVPGSPFSSETAVLLKK